MKGSIPVFIALILVAIVSKCHAFATLRGSSVANNNSVEAYVRAIVPEQDEDKIDGALLKTSKKVEGVISEGENAAVKAEEKAEINNGGDSKEKRKLGGQMVW
eukprot:CAMPEP_0203697590 /NCGR_PEP_ID=MMETSP0091-20130426/11080_1 /ASSEMBLY_ACC=CAM_ASM_001089 /TAXON_ID=426623 /ORGANISM="Chaetoceros affinis, Strain CCMP159" /LENGTH=102 /DNA_ID=CAMNT_0050569627 /DNA_START=43 /DNA_END=348 /DNA_ORIENTATION=+